MMLTPCLADSVRDTSSFASSMTMLAGTCKCGRSCDDVRLDSEFDDTRPAGLATGDPRPTAYTRFLCELSVVDDGLRLIDSGSTLETSFAASAPLPLPIGDPSI